LNTLDLLIIAAYLIGVTLFGLRFRKRQNTLKGYFLADNKIPWWAIALSIVAAETSTLTLISVPGLAYEQDFRLLQLIIGYVLGRVLVSFIFLPRYFSGRLLTAYQLIEQRFGSWLRTLTAGLFLLTRAAAEGVRVFAVALVVRIAFVSAFPTLSELNSDVLAIGVVVLLTLLYTFHGGMAAVIWTDVIQLSIYLCGVLVGVFTILHLIQGGWSTVTAIAIPAKKFRIFDLSPDIFKTYTLWSGVFGGIFLTLASHGTDQLIVQRLLSARSERDAKKALLASGVAVFLQFTLFLFVGALLFVLYRLLQPTVTFSRSDAIFPTFIVTRMPHGVSGLLISAILAAAMSNLSSALNSLSSTSIVDFYARAFPRTSEARLMKLSRVSTIFWAVVLFALAILARSGGRVLEMGLSIASVAYGSLLGVFLLGILTKRANEMGAAIGMCIGLMLNLYLWKFTSIPFTWYVVFGTVATFIIGYAFSLLPFSSDTKFVVGDI
jgi:solute:Na+ symporter, SSS family